MDDDTNDVKLIVVAPVIVSIVSAPANAVVYKTGGGTSPWARYPEGKDAGQISGGRKRRDMKKDNPKDIQFVAIGILALD